MANYWYDRLHLDDGINVFDITKIGEIGGSFLPCGCWQIVIVVSIVGFNHTQWFGHFDRVLGITENLVDFLHFGALFTLVGDQVLEPFVAQRVENVVHIGGWQSVGKTVTLAYFVVNSLLMPNSGREVGEIFVGCLSEFLDMDGRLLDFVTASPLWE